MDNLGLSARCAFRHAGALVDSNMFMRHQDATDIRFFIFHIVELVCDCPLPSIKEA